MSANIEITDNCQAIITKYHGPTNYRGSRISATSASGLRVNVPYASELDTEANHKAAAVALCNKYGWANRPGDRLVSGGLRDGYAWVIINMSASNTLAAAAEDCLPDLEHYAGAPGN